MPFPCQFRARKMTFCNYLPQLSVVARENNHETEKLFSWFGAMFLDGAPLSKVICKRHQILSGQALPSGHAKGGQKIFGKKPGLIRGGTNSLESSPAGAMSCPLSPKFQEAAEDASLLRSL